MSGPQSKRVIVERLIQPGERITTEPGSAMATAAERIATVWELTRACVEWKPEGQRELRLQRSVGRVQRPRR